MRKLFPRDDKDERDQDHTDVFEPHEIEAIFSLPWFVAGTGERNVQGRFHQYCPFHFWTPLLGVLTGRELMKLRNCCWMMFWQKTVFTT